MLYKLSLTRFGYWCTVESDAIAAPTLLFISDATKEHRVGYWCTVESDAITASTLLFMAPILEASDILNVGTVADKNNFCLCFSR